MDDYQCVPWLHDLSTHLFKFNIFSAIWIRDSSFTLYVLIWVHERSQQCVFWGGYVYLYSIFNRFPRVLIRTFKAQERRWEYRTLCIPGISKPAFQFLQVSEPQKPIKTWKPGNRETQVPMLDCPKSGPGPLGPDTKGPGPGPDAADLDLES